MGSTFLKLINSQKMVFLYKKLEIVLHTIDEQLLTAWGITFPTNRLFLILS